jgi:hypothetical protein
MSDEVTIIVPELTPGAGGVADYTLRLVEEWGDRVAPRFILPNDIKTGLRARLPATGGKVLLQYSAYGFDRLGYPRRLLRDLVDWKKTGGGLLVIMFHEIWAFWPRLNKNRFVQWQHRGDIGRLIAQADSVFTSTPSQADHLRKLVPNCNLQVMPVGSNIRCTAPLDRARQPGLAVVFGLQAARIRTLRKFNRLPAAITKIVTVGAQNSAAGDREERALLERFRLTSGLEMRGAVPAPEVSELLALASFALSGQDELSLSKSGTFMACAAHGLNIISSMADSLGAEPLCWLTSPGELTDGVSRGELRSRAENLRAWQEHTASWPIIAERFAEALQFKKTVPA